MLLTELKEMLVYGDKVTIDDPDSKYAGLLGKVTNVQGSVATVKFDGVKNPVMVATTGLKKVN